MTTTYDVLIGSSGNVLLGAARPIAPALKHIHLIIYRLFCAALVDNIIRHSYFSHCIHCMDCLDWIHRTRGAFRGRERFASLTCVCDPWIGHSSEYCLAKDFIIKSYFWWFVGDTALFSPGFRVNIASRVWSTNPLPQTIRWRWSGVPCSIVLDNSTSKLDRFLVYYFYPRK